VDARAPVGELHRSNEKRFQETVWSQIPFNGSSILSLPAFSKPDFEKFFFDVKDIPRMVDFVKETGRLQFALSDDILNYEGLDFLDPIFLELMPPAYHLTSMGVFASESEIKRAMNAFATLAEINLTKFLDLHRAEGVSLQTATTTYDGALKTYVTLKLTKNFLVEEVENLLVDDPLQAIRVLALQISLLKFQHSICW
jgi:hypothetical protein